ncbi:MAG: hypothetical protein M1833_006626 [Piccolia ochrophora]|nr:MAG: hypothetical protein M1833_006626 [Piccolia ochrophora]
MSATGSELFEKMEETQRRYIDAMEKRIAALEALLDKNKDADIKTPSASAQETEKDHDKEQKTEPLKGPSSPATAKGNSSAVPAESAGETGEGDSTAHQAQRRIRFREERWEEGISKVEDVESATPLPVKTPDRSWALTSLKRYDEADRYAWTNVTLDDPAVGALLQVALAHHPAFRHEQDAVTLVSPYEPLIHNWNGLNELAHGVSESSFVSTFRQRLGKFGDQRRAADAKHSSWSGTITSLVDDDAVLAKAIEDLKILLNHITVAPELNLYFETREVQIKSESVSFEYVWTIFPPGEIVFSSPFMKEPQAFLVYEALKSDENPWSLICWTYDYDGSTFNRVAVEFSIDEFKGTRAINTLPVYPLKYHVDKEGKKDAESIKKTLIERGEKFKDFCLEQPGEQMFEYKGDALIRGQDPRFGRSFWLQKAKTPVLSALGMLTSFLSTQGDDQFSDSSSLFSSLWKSDFQTRRGGKNPSENSEVKKLEVLFSIRFLTLNSQIEEGGRVMIDFKSYYSHCPTVHEQAPMGSIRYSSDVSECPCSACHQNEPLLESQKLHYDAFLAAKKGPFEGCQYLLCPPRVLGYHLSSKKWVELNVSEVRKIKNKISRSAFNSLEMKDSKQKHLIRDLVRSHTNNRKASTHLPLMKDLIKGKGEGLVILLYGPPGVGKTLTAESVAQATGRPLFPVSVAEIGLEPTQVELNLGVMFELAASWQAVLLFDEADVFLESRTSFQADLQRNALVSVLLRVLEYYEGILILTTNRLKQFDHAVLSRVNLAVKYEDLNEEQKRNIFEKFIRQLNDSNTENIHEIRNWIGKEETMDYFEKTEWSPDSKHLVLRSITGFGGGKWQDEVGRHRIDCKSD